MRYRRSSLSIVFHSIISFIILIVLLIIANILVPSINNDVYSKVVQFFNSLLGLFIILFLVGMINSLFWNFDFPLNILAPISGAVLGVYIVDLVYKILGFTQTFVYFGDLAKLLSYNISVIVFFVVLIAGYLIILSEAGKREEKYPRKERYPEEESERRRIKERIAEKKSRKSSESNFSWDEVGDEFKKAFLNVGKALNRAFEGKDKKNKRIKK
jgi:hypothetical protein